MSATNTDLAVGYAAPPGMMLVPIPKRWASGLCDCFEDTKSCWDVFWCMPCNIARQWGALSGKNDCLHWPICIANTFFGCVLITNCILRCNIAARYNIDEDSCGSCLSASILPLCSACQTYRELAVHGAWPGGTCFVGIPPQPVPLMGGSTVTVPLENSGPVVGEPLLPPGGYAHIDGPTPTK